MKKVLITGTTGFAGNHLVGFLLTRSEITIYGLKRWNTSMNNLSHIPDLKNKVNLFTCNILDPSSAFIVIEQIRPDWIFHLATESFTKR